MSGHPVDTSLDAYAAVRDAGEDDSLRFRVAAALADEPMTTNELGQEIPEHSANAIRPRVNELLRMGCIKREGKRTNPSGHDAYVHHITTRGRQYLAGNIDPEPGPALSETKTKVVDVARAVVYADADIDVLQIAVEEHDKLKQRTDPEWERPNSSTHEDD